VNDAAEPLVQGIALFFRQQFGGMADRRQGIADFVRHVGRQAPQCGELHLLGLGLHTLHVLKIDQRMPTASADGR
jgi:hypothetical protein